jgi:hypothetical protein
MPDHLSHLGLLLLLLLLTMMSHNCAYTGQQASTPLLARPHGLFIFFSLLRYFGAIATVSRALHCFFGGYVGDRVFLALLILGFELLERGHVAMAV